MVIGRTWEVDIELVISREINGHDRSYLLLVG